MLIVQVKVDPAATRLPSQEGLDIVTWPWDEELAEVWVDIEAEVEDAEVVVETSEVVL